jgi:chromosome segregation ATPase
MAEGDTRATRASLRHELELVEAESAQLRESASRLRRQIGERWFEPTDESERAAMITAAEEQEALVDSMEARREQLRKRIEPAE